VIFEETALPGAFIVKIEPHGDVRGYFSRTWCAREFAAHGLPAGFVQASLSHNHKRGTVRGMHTQLPPSQEGKLVQCTRGAIHDVIIDLRPDSPAYLRHVGVDLTADAHNALYIPPGMLHGFQTLEDDSEVFYQMTDFYAPELGFGARWNDPVFGIRWPITTGLVMAERDATYPDFDRSAYEQQVANAREASAK
jgi:dTDP-4-dehydrorhamnose 3,5-epimerase